MPEQQADHLSHAGHMLHPTNHHVLQHVSQHTKHAVGPAHSLPQSTCYTAVRPMVCSPARGALDSVGTLACNLQWAQLTACCEAKQCQTGLQGEPARMAVAWLQKFVGYSQPWSMYASHARLKRRLS